jgi:methylenetetrahydrofolate reductase (NADPH)
VPIIPGLKILTRKRHLQTLPKYFHTEIPEPLAAEIEAADDEEHIRQIGVDWALQQSAELMSADVPCIHFYIMSSANTVKQVVEPLREMA